MSNCKLLIHKGKEHDQVLYQYRLFSIINTYYWARTLFGKTSELTLDESSLANVFDAFPALYGKSKDPSSNGQHCYSLHARYAKCEGGDTSEPDKVFYIEPLETEKIDMLIQFVLRIAEQEKTDERNGTANKIAVCASVVSAVIAVIVGVMALIF